MMKIRTATIHDLPAIVAIYNSTIPSGMVTADTDPVTVESRLDWFHSFTNERPLWIAEQDTIILAWMSFRSFYGRPAYKGTAEIAIYIAENARAKGTGQQLITYAEQEARRIGIKTILAFIFGHNLPSLAFFRKNGYSDYGRLPEVAEINGQACDLLILGKKTG